MKIKKTDIRVHPTHFLEVWNDDKDVIIYHTQVTFAPFEILFEFRDKCDTIYWTEMTEGFFLAAESLSEIRKEIREYKVTRYERFRKMFNHKD